MGLKEAIKHQIKAQHSQNPISFTVSPQEVLDIAKEYIEIGWKLKENKKEEE